MARFSFRLEKVLKWRRHLEDKEKMAFAAAVHLRELALQRLAEVRRLMAEALAAAAELVAGLPTIEDLVRSYEYRVALMRQEDEALADLARRNQELEAARLKLIEARKQRRVLEKLKEKHRAKWRLAEEYAEENELGEMNMQIFHRRQAEATA